jgi:hypothetical protein
VCPPISSRSTRKRPEPDRSQRPATWKLLQITSQGFADQGPQNHHVARRNASAHGPTSARRIATPRELSDPVPFPADATRAPSPGFSGWPLWLWQLGHGAAVVNPKSGEARTLPGWPIG